MPTSEIENYIYLLSQGLDSGGAGRFTLNKLVKSAALLAAADQYPYRWIYFALQAAVSAGAVSAQVGSNANSVSVEFDLAEVHQEFLSPDLLLGESAPSQEAVRLWAQALLWANALSPHSILILCRGEHPGYQATIVGEHSSRHLLPPARQRTRLALLVNFANNPKLRVRLSAHLEKGLAQDMGFAPLGIRLEGREPSWGHSPRPGYNRVALCMANLQRPSVIGLAQPQALKIGSYRSLRQSGEVFHSDGPQLVLSGDIPDHPAQWTDLRTNWTNLSLYKTAHKECLFALDYVPKIPGTNVVRARAIAFYHGQAPSQFSPIRDGLRLRPFILPEAPAGWEVYWPTPGHPTDYPGTAAVENEAMLDMHHQAIQWLTLIHNCR